MMNPDRSELVKLEAERAELVAKNEAATSWGAAVGARCERIKGLDSRIAALRRLAPSDGGVKGEPVGYLYSLDGSLDVSFSQKRKPEYMRNEPWTETPLFTAPPADAGIREALERLKQGIRDIAQACVDGRVCDDVAWFTEIPAETLFDKCCNLLGEDLPTQQSALTAPGATTKSDGLCFCYFSCTDAPNCRRKAALESDVEALAATTAERPGTVTSEPEPSTSDPSSTRSEVTVEEIVSVMGCLLL